MSESTEISNEKKTEVVQSPSTTQEQSPVVPEGTETTQLREVVEQIIVVRKNLEELERGRDSLVQQLIDSHQAFQFFYTEPHFESSEDPEETRYLSAHELETLGFTEKLSKLRSILEAMKLRVAEIYGADYDFALFINPYTRRNDTPSDLAEMHGQYERLGLCRVLDIRERLRENFELLYEDVEIDQEANGVVETWVRKSEEVR